jgi:hypothetical protein
MTNSKLVPKNTNFSKKSKNFQKSLNFPKNAKNFQKAKSWIILVFFGKFGFPRKLTFYNIDTSTADL